jgi:hypothetical protein
MANEIKIKTSSDCQSVIVYETSGEYSECCNETGWGEPNLKTTDISESYLLIKGPTMSEAKKIDTTGIFPSATELGFELLAEDLGIQKIDSGVYTVELVCLYQPGTEDAETIQTKCYFLFSECLKCCIENKMAKVNLLEVDSKETQMAVRMRDLYTNMVWAAEHGKYNDANVIAEYLRNLCDCCL